MIRQYSQALIQSIMSTPYKPRATRPWIIWVERVTSQSLYLAVYAPKYRSFLWFGDRKLTTQIVHTEGPIYFSSDREQSERTQELIEIGMEHVHPDADFRTSLSFADTQEIIEDTWKR